MNCPSCQQKMRSLPTAKVELLSCEDCVGVWFSQGQLAQVDLSSEEFLDYRESAENLKVTSCPACDLPMHWHKYPKALQVECPECYSCGGVFLSSLMIKEISENSMNDAQREAYLNSLARSVPGFLEAETVMNSRNGLSGFASFWDRLKWWKRKK